MRVIRLIWNWLCLIGLFCFGGIVLVPIAIWKACTVDEVLMRTLQGKKWIFIKEIKERK